MYILLHAEIAKNNSKVNWTNLAKNTKAWFLINILCLFSHQDQVIYLTQRPNTKIFPISTIFGPKIQTRWLVRRPEKAQKVLKTCPSWKMPRKTLFFLDFRVFSKIFYMNHCHFPAILVLFFWSFRHFLEFN